MYSYIVYILLILLTSRECDMHQQHQDKFLVCLKNVLGNKALSDSDFNGKISSCCTLYN